MFRKVISATALLLAPLVQAQADSLIVSQGWVRESIPGQTTTVAYFQLANEGGHPCELTGFQSSAAARIELHEHRHQNGKMMMRKVDARAVPAGGRLLLEPMGLHLMIMELHSPLKQGDEVELILNAGECGVIRTVLPVRKIR